MNWKEHVSHLSKYIVALGIIVMMCVGCHARPHYYLYVYYAKTCPVCKSLMNNVIPELEKKFGNTMKISYYDIDEETSIEAYAKTCSLLEDYYIEDDSGSVPFIVLDGYFAKVGYEIGQNEELIQAIDDAIEGKPVSSQLNDIYYFQKGRTFH